MALKLNIKSHADPCSLFRMSLQPLADEIRSALKKGQNAFRECLEDLLKTHPSAKDLPRLRNFILMHIMGKVKSWIDKETDAVTILVDIEGVEPLDVQGADA